jgi:osmotically-inducible protein OsmY
MTRGPNTIDARQRDSEIFAAARHALDERPTVPPEVRIHVEHGYVTLTGSVRWPNECEEAQRVVRDLPGVLGVINSIVVAHVPNPEGLESPE